MHVTAEVLTQLLEISPDALIVIDQAGKIEMANGQTEAMFGYQQVEVYLSQPSLVVDVDPGRVEQVLLNLIGNAIKYSPRGGSVIVKLWEEATEQAIHISVQGHGIGIPEHQQMQIFGRFIQAENAQAWSNSTAAVSGSSQKKMQVLASS